MKKPEEAKNTADFKKEEAEQPELKSALKKKKLVVNKSTDSTRHTVKKSYSFKLKSSNRIELFNEVQNVV